MARSSYTQRVEIIGRQWLTGELVRAGLEVAGPVRDDGVDLLVLPEDYSWTQPVQVKTHLDRDINVYPKYARDDRHDRRPLLMAYTLLGDSQAPMPDDTGGVFLRSYNDYSPRLLVLTPREAWALPSISGKADADQDSPYRHRLNWVSCKQRTRPARRGRRAPRPAPDSPARRARATRRRDEGLADLSAKDSGQPCRRRKLTTGHPEGLPAQVPQDGGRGTGRRLAELQ
jgi:hypothetical protein